MNLTKRAVYCLVSREFLSGDLCKFYGMSMSRHCVTRSRGVCVCLCLCVCLFSSFNTLFQTQHYGQIDCMLLDFVKGAGWIKTNKSRPEHGLCCRHSVKNPPINQSQHCNSCMNWMHIQMYVHNIHICILFVYFNAYYCAAWILPKHKHSFDRNAH